MPSTFLAAEWRKLIMAQYLVSPETLLPWLPSGLELDFYTAGSEARCYVSLVGFLFDQVRIKGVSIPFHTSFEEINLRFYVKRRVAATATAPGGAFQRGVVFIREFVPRAAITFVANTFYEEPYATLPTLHTIQHTSRALIVGYSWRHLNTWHTLAVEADPTPQRIAPDSEEEFITEHYWGYTRRSSSDGLPRTSAYEVQHPRWQVYPIRCHNIVVDFGALYGPAFAALNHQAPAGVLLAEGSAVSVFSGGPLPPQAQRTLA